MERDRRGNKLIGKGALCELNGARGEEADNVCIEEGHCCCENCMSEGTYNLYIKEKVVGKRETIQETAIRLWASGPCPSVLTGKGSEQGKDEGNGKGADKGDEDTKKEKYDNERAERWAEITMRAMYFKVAHPQDKDDGLDYAPSLTA